MCATSVLGYFAVIGWALGFTIITNQENRIDQATALMALAAVYINEHVNTLLDTDRAYAAGTIGEGQMKLTRMLIAFQLASTLFLLPTTFKLSIDFSLAIFVAMMALL